MGYFFMPTNPNTNIIIDRRSIWVVALDRMRRGILLTLIFLLFLFLLIHDLMFFVFL